MKKNRLRGIQILGIIMIVGISTSAYANQEETYAHSSRSINEKVTGENKEKFFYNKGVADGFEDGKRVGYEEAMKDAKEALLKYKNYIKSLESGKYLSKKGKITPPRIYQEKRPDGSISVVVQGCNIEGELSPKDILMFPVLENGTPRTYKEGGNGISPTDTTVVSDSVYLAGVDYKKKSKPSGGDFAKKATFRTFVDNSFYRKLFRGSGLPFSIQPNSKIRVMFPSNTEAESFMQRHGLIKGKDYR